MNEVINNRVAKLDFVFHVAGMPFNGHTIRTESLGGSETAAYYLARELAKAGHRVCVFTTHSEGGEADGVSYLPMGETSESAPLGATFEMYAQHTPHDVLILQRHPLGMHKQWNAKVCIHQMHDLALHRMNGSIQQGMWQTDAVTGVSAWHCEQMKSVYGIKDALLRPVPNGVDLALYDDANWPVMPVVRTAGCEQPERVKVGQTEIIQLQKDEFLMLYQSRPERGLEHLVRPGGIMQRFAEAHVPARLIVVGYDNTTPQMAAAYAQWRAWGDALPNVTFLGAMDKPHLAQLQKHCDLMLYPTEFEEVSCITAMEAMAAGLPLLTSDCAALAETCADAVALGGTELLPLKDGRADEDAFFDRAMDKLAAWRRADEVWPAKREAQRMAALSKTWAIATDALLDVVRDCFERRSQSLASVVRSAIERSDIVFADWLLRSGGWRHENPGRIVERAGMELDGLYAFARDPVKLQAHYDYHQSKYYDEFEERVVGEDVTATARFRGTAQMLHNVLATATSRRRILDYGCAHGHYLVPLAHAFSQHTFVGRDISQRAVDAAARWAAREGLRNVEVSRGTQADVTLLGKFDVILAGEVLEHVWDARGLLETFRAMLNPGGTIIVTTPHGRWEHSGTEAFRTGREHLHHFERADIVEMCAGMDAKLLYAPAAFDRSGFGMGSWVWSVRPHDRAFSPIDYRRKLAYYAPRGSISACLIVKDGEKTLRKCIESFVDWVDEVVVAVDPSTTDRTRAVLDQIATDFPYRAFCVTDLDRPVMETGFAAARNVTVDAAVGEWVLWCDADEEIHSPWRLHTVTRPSGIDGYCYAQIHYSADPPQVLTTDYPCRMFRRSTGARFYGIVHEHPEVEPGKAVPYSVMRPDVRFIHAGYVDEETRRRRYRRNFPLLTRDMKENPTRGLNKFLWLRDIAQGIMFEREQAGMQVLPGHRERAAEGVALFDKMLHDENTHLRMIVDSLQYYSFCNDTLGNGFSAEVSFKCATPQAPDMAVSADFKGLFANREHLSCLLNRFSQESTKHYEAKYL